ncbi:MAG TPA: VOC family protein [Nakamurella sp.]
MSNEVDYFEIGTPHPDAARAFYGGLFGWQIGPPSAPAQYAAVETDKGGLWDTSGMGGTTWAIFYVRVDDVGKAVADAERLGATIAIPLVDNGTIEFAHLVDPDGNRFGIWKPK